MRTQVEASALWAACSSTARTCSGVTPGNHATKSATDAPSSRFSKRAATGIRLHDAALPGVRHADHTLLLGQPGDAHGVGQAATAGHVRLDDVEVAVLDQLPEAPRRRVVLASRDRDSHRVGKLGVGIKLVRL